MNYILIGLAFLVCLGLALLGGLLISNSINKAVKLWDKYVTGNDNENE